MQLGRNASALNAAARSCTCSCASSCLLAHKTRAQGLKRCTSQSACSWAHKWPLAGAKIESFKIPRGDALRCAVQVQTNKTSPLEPSGALMLGGEQVTGCPLFTFQCLSLPDWPLAEVQLPSCVLSVELRQVCCAVCRTAMEAV